MKSNRSSRSTAELMRQLFVAHYWLPRPVGEGAGFYSTDSSTYRADKATATADRATDLADNTPCPMAAFHQPRARLRPSLSQNGLAGRLALLKSCKAI